MKLSTRARYGLRLMVYLAKKYKQGPVQLKNISEEENVSEKYLSQIVLPLKTAGLIKSIRGAGGGYTLRIAPEKITVKQIVEILEGDIYPVECITRPEICDRVAGCVTRKVWSKLGDEISRTLESITLDKLVEDAAKLESK